MSKTTIVQDVLDVFRAAGFEVRVSEFGNKPETIIYGTSDNAGILMESVCEHFGSSTEAAFSRAQRENKDGSAPLTAPAPLTEEQKEDQFWDAENWERAREKARARMAAPAHQQSEGLSDERIAEIYRAEFNGMPGAARQAPQNVPALVIEFARAIEREVAKAAPAAPVQIGPNTASVLDTLWQRVTDAREAAYTFGDTCKEAVEVALDGVLDMLVHADLAVPDVAAPVQTRIPVAVQGMADCMDMVRQELIEAGVIDASVAPMFLANAVVAKLQEVAAPVQADQAQVEPVAWMNPETLDVIHDTRKRAWENDFGMGGKAKAAGYTYRLVAPAQAEQVAAVPDIVREAVEAAFEDRAGWRTKIAGAVRALATKEAAAQVPAEKGGAA